MNTIEATGILKQFANITALDHVDIAIPENTVYGLLGPNGAGKTTFIRIINQITAPDKGVILFNGSPLKQEDISGIGYLPEERGLYRKMKVGEQALYLARLKGMSRSDAMKKLKHWFEKFEIQAWWDKKVEELSKGMQQKVQFVTTVLHEPKLLIFDEPFSGFDPINANILKKEILELKKNGATIIFSTHNMSSVEEICDEITLINKAKVVLNGNVTEIKNQYKSNKYRFLLKGSLDGVDALIPQGCSALSHIQTDGISELILQSAGKRTTNQLLADMMTNFEIHGFQEVIPDMNEIFIKVVGEDNIPEME